VSDLVGFLCKPAQLAIISMLVSRTRPSSGPSHCVPHGAFDDKVKLGGERADFELHVETSKAFHSGMFRLSMPHVELAITGLRRST
jgi:hypothetical protein